MGTNIFFFCFLWISESSNSSSHYLSLFSDDEDSRNICSWLGEYDGKTLCIESEDDYITESMEQKEVPFSRAVNDTSHVEEYKTYSKKDTLVQTKPEKFGYQEAHLEEAVIANGKDNVGIDKFETVGENGGEATGDIPNLGLERVNDSESILDENEGELDNAVEKVKEKQVEEEEDVEEVLEVLEGDNEEEYYLIEEIIEESEEAEADIGESEWEQTGENLREDEHPHKVVKKQCKRREYEVFVGGLHRCASREDINEVFSQVGEVKSIRIAMDRWSNKNKGYAFVQYKTVEQARCALTELKNPVVCSLDSLFSI